MFHAMCDVQDVTVQFVVKNDHKGKLGIVEDDLFSNVGL
jgi:hypothetical protein